MVDGIILFFLFVMFITGFSRGTLRQLWSLVVLALATYLSGNFYPSFTDLVRTSIPDPTGANLVSCILVFGVVSGILNGVVDAGARLRRERGDKKPGFVDRSVGSILGVIEAIGFVQVAAAVLVAFPVLGLDRWVETSKLLGAFFNIVPVMMPLLPGPFQQILLLF